MDKYIDAEKLIVEIERRKKDNGKDGRPSNVAEMLYSHLLSFIASLQQEQPEVDLEKEYNEQWGGYTHDGLSATIDRTEFEQIASHFYELGLKARKEE